jgi:hypothetical protein
MILSASAAPAAPVAGRPDPMAACAAYDVHVMALIEDHAAFGDMSFEALVSAREALSEARLACRWGDVERGLEIYASIPLAPVPIGPFTGARAR